MRCARRARRRSGSSTASHRFSPPAYAHAICRRARDHPAQSQGGARGRDHGLSADVRAIRLSFSAIDRRLETVARTLGGSRIGVFFSVTVPLALPGIVTGIVLSFARSLGEFGATITFVSNIPGETQTLLLAIYTYTQSPSGDTQALRLSVIAVILSFVALVAAEWITRRKSAVARP